MMPSYIIITENVFILKTDTLTDDLTHYMQESLGALLDISDPANPLEYMLADNELEWEWKPVPVAPF